MEATSQLSKVETTPITEAENADTGVAITVEHDNTDSDISNHNPLTKQPVSDIEEPLFDASEETDEVEVNNPAAQQIIIESGTSVHIKEKPHKAAQSQLEQTSTAKAQQPARETNTPKLPAIKRISTRHAHPVQKTKEIGAGNNQGQHIQTEVQQLTSAQQIPTQPQLSYNRSIPEHTAIITPPQSVRTYTSQKPRRIWWLTFPAIGIVSFMGFKQLSSITTPLPTTTIQKNIQNIPQIAPPKTLPHIGYSAPAISKVPTTFVRSYGVFANQATNFINKIFPFESTYNKINTTLNVYLLRNLILAILLRRKKKEKVRKPLVTEISSTNHLNNNIFTFQDISGENRVYNLDEYNDCIAAFSNLSEIVTLTYILPYLQSKKTGDIVNQIIQLVEKIKHTLERSQYTHHAHVSTLDTLLHNLALWKNGEDIETGFTASENESSKKLSFFSWVQDIFLYDFSDKKYINGLRFERSSFFIQYGIKRALNLQTNSYGLFMNNLGYFSFKSPFNKENKKTFINTIKPGRWKRISTPEKMVMIHECSHLLYWLMRDAEGINTWSNFKRSFDDYKNELIAYGTMGTKLFPTSETYTSFTYRFVEDINSEELAVIKNTHKEIMQYIDNLKERNIHFQNLTMDILEAQTFEELVAIFKRTVKEPV